MAGTKFSVRLREVFVLEVSVKWEFIVVEETEKVKSLSQKM